MKFEFITAKDFRKVRKLIMEGERRSKIMKRTYNKSVKDKTRKQN